MRYSKKLETYVSPDDILERYKINREEGVRDLLWRRIWHKYPKISQSSADMIYLELEPQIWEKYELIIIIKRKAK